MALPAFRARLENGTGWHPEQGASLASFFIGQCLLCFPNEYRRWLREHRTGSCLVPLSDALELPDRGPGPNQLVTWRLEASHILAQAPARTRAVLAQIALGYPHRDIAEHLGTTPKAIEMILRRHRRRLVRWRDDPFHTADDDRSVLRASLRRSRRPQFASRR